MNKKIETVIQLFRERRMVLGSYYEDNAKAAKNLFQGVTLHGKDYKNYSQIDPETSYRTLKE
jgi:hypothetical protein